MPKVFTDDLTGIGNLRSVSGNDYLLSREYEYLDLNGELQAGSMLQREGKKPLERIEIYESGTRTTSYTWSNNLLDTTSSQLTSSDNFGVPLEEKDTVTRFEEAEYRWDADERLRFITVDVTYDSRYFDSSTIEIEYIYTDDDAYVDAISGITYRYGAPDSGYLLELEYTGGKKKSLQSATYYQSDQVTERTENAENKFYEYFQAEYIEQTTYKTVKGVTFAKVEADQDADGVFDLISVVEIF